jgi:hypothetical protein
MGIDPWKVLCGGGKGQLTPPLDRSRLPKGSGNHAEKAKQDALASKKKEYTFILLI